MEAPSSGGHRIKSGDGGPRIDLCQGESGSGASLGAIIASLTGCYGTQRWFGVQRRLLCAEQE